jgi:hypothetical protein
MLKLPIAIINEICKMVDKNVREELLRVNQFLKLICLNNIKSILIRPPRSTKNYDNKISQNTIINIINIINSINFYSCATKIIFSKIYLYEQINEIFNQMKNITCNQNYLKKLKVDETKQVSLHPLHNIKKIKFNEIFGLKNIDVLYHSNLEAISLNTDFIRIHTIKTIIPQSTLDMLKYLTKIKLDCFDSILDILFNNQTKLLSVKLYHMFVNHDIIDSLKNCTDLDTLILESKNSKPDDLRIQNVIMNSNWKKLKRLEISEVGLFEIDELKKLTANFPNLEYLCVKIYDIHSFGFLKENCPNIIALKFNCFNNPYVLKDLNHGCNINDDDVLNIVKLFPDLKMFSLANTNNITGESLTHISNYCHELRILELCGFENITMDHVRNLVNGCPRIRVLIFDDVKKVEVNAYEYLINNLNELEYVKSNNLIFGHSNTRVFMYDACIAYKLEDYEDTKHIYLINSRIKNKRICLKIQKYLNVYKFI